MISSSKRISIAIIGTIIEWTEYSFYAYMAIFIGKLFFPQQSDFLSILSVFFIFAAGYLMRPLGALYFGHIGDTIGRKHALSGSILLMAIATIGIGLTPTYESIGIYAPLLLMFFRLLQGFAVAGEFNGASIYLIEHSKSYPCLAGSWPGFAAAFGMMIGAISASIVTADHMPDWAWRVPFLLGFFGCIIGYYIRTSFDESPEFLKIQTKKRIEKTPIFVAFKSHKLALLKTMACAGFVAANVYLCNISFISYIKLVSGIDHHTALKIATFGETLVVILIPIMAILADKFGHRLLLILGFAIASFGVFVLFYWAQSGSIAYMYWGQAFYALWNAMISGAIFKYIYDLYKAEVKYSGFSFAWCLSTAFIGGLAPIISLSLVNHGWLYAPAIYVAFFAIVNLCIQAMDNYVTIKKNYSRILRLSA